MISRDCDALRRDMFVKLVGESCDFIDPLYKTDIAAINLHHTLTVLSRFYKAGGLRTCATFLVSLLLAIV
jgi:hypothetical protein